MLPFTLVLLSVTAVTQARSFNITHLIVPEVVPAGQTEVEMECRYDANFTLLSWFKGPSEFFRYKPGAAPTTKSFPTFGVGRIELIACGPVACRLKLGGLTEEATGLYRCDIEHDEPPYKFASRTAYMVVHGHEHRRPSLEGIADKYGEDDLIQGYCRGAPDSEIRWYINGREVEGMRDSKTLKRRSSRLIYLGIPPVVTVQCAEFQDGVLIGSKEVKAQWKDERNNKRDERPMQHLNHSCKINNLTFLVFMSSVVYVLCAVLV